MSITLTNPRSVTGLAATAAAGSPSTSWREPIGAASRQIQLAAATSPREIMATLGAVGNKIVGTLDGEWTLTGDTTGTRATGTLTFGANAADGKIVTVGTRVYTFKTALTAANQVKIGADASASLDNLIAAVNGAAGAGTTYGTGTVAHTLVTAAAGAGDTAVFTAKAYSSSGNAIVSTTDVGSGSWGAATLTGGVTPCLAEGILGVDMTGDTLETAAATDGFEVVVHAGAVKVNNASEIPASPGLRLEAPAVLHIAGPKMTDRTWTVEAAAIDTTVSVTALYH